MLKNGDEGNGGASTRGVDWSDPNVAAGNSPRLPAWPVWVSGALWGCWLVFLAVTAFTGGQSPSG